MAMIQIKRQKKRWMNKFELSSHKSSDGQAVGVLIPEAKVDDSFIAVLNLCCSWLS